MNRMIERIQSKLKESLIDYPQKDLTEDIWDIRKDTYLIKKDVKDKILNVLSMYEDVDLLEIAEEIRIVGSLCSNQYTEETDIDVHIVPKDLEMFGEEDVSTIMSWFEDNREFLDGFIKRHPIEVYIQLNPAQDFLSYGLYDLNNDEWKKKPKKMPLNYDPYEDFEDILKEVNDYVENADVLFGKLKRNVIDYDTIKNAIRRLPEDSRNKLLSQLVQKLQDIEDNIESLYKEKKEWTDLRHDASSPASIEQARKDVELVKKWKDIDATFKFINRYKYMRTIKDLYQLIEDEGIESMDVQTIKRIIGR